MILDAWFWTGLVIGAVSFVVCVVMTAIRRHPADASILSVAAVELFTLVYAAAAAVRQLGGDTLNGPGWEFWGYILTALIVPVIAVGQDAIPAFWSRDSGLPAPLRLDDPSQIAAAARMRRALGIPGGQLVVNPIPAESEIPRAEMIPVVDAALADAAAQGIAAKEVTPFLLDRIYALTEGRSLTANIALVLSNARLAARIAAAGA